MFDQLPFSLFEFRHKRKLKFIVLAIILPLIKTLFWKYSEQIRISDSFFDAARCNAGDHRFTDTLKKVIKR